MIPISPRRWSASPKIFWDLREPSAQATAAVLRLKDRDRPSGFAPPRPAFPGQERTLILGAGRPLCAGDRHRRLTRTRGRTCCRTGEGALRAGDADRRLGRDAQAITRCRYRAWGQRYLRNAVQSHRWYKAIDDLSGSPHGIAQSRPRKNRELAGGEFLR